MTATTKVSPDLARRWRELYPKLGQLSSSPAGGFNYTPFSGEHLAAINAESRETSRRLAVGWGVFKTSLQLSLCLFATLACQAFGLALFCLFLAGWEARDVCELIDAPA